MLAVLVLCLVLLGDSTTDAETECGRPPDVQGALPEPEFRDITSFPSGATIQYRCDVKHYLVDLTSWSRNCSDGEWGEVQFRCIVKSCPALNTPDNGQRMDFNYEVGTFAEFACNTGYEMVGVAQLLCRTDMEWSPKDPPTCKPVRCPDESYLANGRVVQETYRQEKNTFGITNRYFCNSGYVLKGSSARTCQASKSWSGIEPICDLPRCPDMRVENGEIKYIGDRARYTHAHVNCNDGYTVGKDGVETVECLGSLQWESILRCYKTLKPWKPDNSRFIDLGDEDQDLEHHDTYKIRCKGDYEMKQAHGRYLGGDERHKRTVEVENLNGALKFGEIDAYTLSCVEKRCFQMDQSKYPNVVIQPKTKYVEHGESYHLSCENGFEDSLKSDPDFMCSSGKLGGTTPHCKEKPCDTPTIENGVLLNWIRWVYPKSIIESGDSVALQCSEGFFLYENRKNEFMEEHVFRIKCYRGNITTSIPSCKKASRCELPNDPYASYYVNGEIHRGNSTISHEDKVDRVECESGTSLTKPLDGRNRCWDGDWKLGVELPVCKPDPCSLIKENGRRFILMGTEVKREVEHGNKVNVVCDEDYDIVGHDEDSNLEILCQKGQFDKIFHCVEKPCDTPAVKNGVLRKFHKWEYSKPTIVSGDIVSLQCSEGFFLYENRKNEFMEEHEFRIKCYRGNITSIPSCKKASRCELPNDPYASYYVNSEMHRGNNTISHEDEVDRVECESGTSLTKPLNGKNRCWDGNWKLGAELPVCEPDPCGLNEEIGRRFISINGKEVESEVAHGNKVNVVCDDGDYDIVGNDEDSNSEIQCLKGKFDKMYHCVERCTIPDISNATTTRSNGTHTDKLKHGENVSVSCEDEFILYDNKKFIEEGSFIMTCASGKIPSIPSCRKALNCSLPRDPYALYYVNGEKHIGATILHESKVHVECENGTSLIVSSDDVRTCRNGDWKSRDPFPVCVQGCAIPDIPNANITRTNGKHTDKLKHGENITVTCHEGYSVQNSEVDDYYLYLDYLDDDSNDAHFNLTCKNGTIGNKKCELSQDSKDQQENMDPKMKPSVLNCTIPETTDVHFVTLSGEKLKEGTKIPNGKKFIAEKECKDYYEGYYLNYDAVDGEEISPPKRPINKIVNCTDGVLSDYTLVCDDVDTSDTAVTKLEGCMTVQNGIVTDNGQSVECNEGYVNAHSLLYERYSCSCDRDIPALVCNGRKAKCNPVNCTLDSPIEQGMTLYYKGRFVTASSIEAIAHGESVTFNCEIGANDIAYEPKRRLFKCDRGEWLEKNRKVGSWSLGNNGTFPKCRPAKCQCQYGGTCVRDEKCTCPNFSTGQQCETPICPDGCQNGGTCTSPKMCSCPKGFSGNRCQTEEGCQAPIDKGNDAFYRNGATYTVSDESCSGGNVPSFKGQITCESGRWSEQVICLKGASYRITVKTANRWFAGTDGEVYFYMYGSKRDSGKIILRGGFETGHEDLMKGHFVDVGKISKIRLGVKSVSLTRDGWIPESVLIEDESRGDFYKFVHGAEIDDTSIYLYPVASCYPSKNLRDVYPIYFVGDELHLKPSNCAQGYEPQPPSTTCKQRGWTADVVCVKRSSYRIRIKTSYYRKTSREKQHVYIKIDGSIGEIGWTKLNQTLKSKTLTEERLITDNIGQIKRIVLSSGGYVYLLPDYVTIHVEDTDDLYVFRYSGGSYIHNKSTALYPEGHCSRPFLNHPSAKELKVQVIQERKAKDETDCQIQCLEHPKCKMIVYNKRLGYCTAYVYGQKWRRVEGVVFELSSCY